MVFTLACETERSGYSSPFQGGYVPVAYTLSGGSTSDEVLSNCRAHYSTTLIHFHGTHDPVVDYESGYLDALGAIESYEIWRRRNHCALNPVNEFQITESTSCRHSMCGQDFQTQSQMMCTVEGGDLYLYDDIGAEGLASEALKLLDNNRFYPPNQRRPYSDCRHKRPAGVAGLSSTSHKWISARYDLGPGQSAESG